MSTMTLSGFGMAPLILTTLLYSLLSLSIQLVVYIPDRSLVLEISEIQPVPVMLVSFKGWITLLPSINEFLEIQESLFRCHVPLVGVTYSFEFFDDLLFIPGFNLARDVSFQVNSA